MAPSSSRPTQIAYCCLKAMYSALRSRDAAGTLLQAELICLAIMNIVEASAWFLLLIVLGCVAGQSIVGFDAAAASSSHATGDFGAAKALTAASGYWCRRAVAVAGHSPMCRVVCWCSAGDHDPSQVVSWFGTMHTTHNAVGLRISWCASSARGALWCG